MWNVEGFSKKRINIEMQSVASRVSKHCIRQALTPCRITATGGMWSCCVAPLTGMSKIMCVKESSFLSAISSCRHRSVGLTLQTHIFPMDTHTQRCPPEPEVPINLVRALTGRFSAGAAVQNINEEWNCHDSPLHTVKRGAEGQVEFGDVYKLISCLAKSSCKHLPAASSCFSQREVQNGCFVFAALFLVGVKCVINPSQSSYLSLWQW